MSLNEHLIVLAVLAGSMFLMPTFGLAELYPLLYMVPLGVLYGIILLICVLRKKFIINRFQGVSLFLILTAFTAFATALIFYMQIVYDCNQFNIGANFFDHLGYKVVIAHCDDTQSQPYTNY